MTAKALPIVLIGAGGHAVSVADALLEGDVSIAACLDDRCADAEILGIAVVREEGWNFFAEDYRYIVAIGDNRRRSEIYCRLGRTGVGFAAAQSPSALVSRHAEVGIGTVVLRGAAINARTRIGPNSIVNSRASIDHDCVIGDSAHIGPGAVLPGNVNVGDLAFIGAGSTILPGITIGRGAVVGAGSVVTRDVAPFTAVCGVPAREMTSGRRSVHGVVADTY